MDDRLQSEPLISFIVPVRDDAEALERCLRSVNAARASTASELIVVDNGSRDRSAEVAANAGARVISAPGLPVAELRNRAAQVARGELLAFIDADHELVDTWLTSALDHVNNSDVAAVGAEYHPPKAATWVQEMFDNFRTHPLDDRFVDWLPSGNLIVRRATFMRIGGFDTRLESCEDVDFCQRLRRAGGRLLHVAALRSVHFGDPKTLGALFRSELWRGRDNLRVSFREPLTLRSMPSVAIPVVNLLAMFVAVAGLVSPSNVGLVLAGLSVLTFVLLATLRAVRLFSRVPRGRRRARHLVEALLVSAVYDLARALALVWRAPHTVRRKGKT